MAHGAPESPMHEVLAQASVSEDGDGAGHVDQDISVEGLAVVEGEDNELLASAN